MKYIIEFDDFLNESKELDIANKYKSVIPDNMFTILSKIDVTPTRKYLDKICNFFVNDKAPDTSKIENLHHVFTNFDHLTNKKIIKGKDSDITKYKTLKDLNIVVNKYSKIESELLEKKLKKANIIRIKDDKDLFICVPLDEETSKIYGSNTRWCVSAREKNAYHIYFADRKQKNDDYYSSLLENILSEGGGGGDDSCFVSFIINKQLESSNPLHKMAIQFGLNDGYMEYNFFDSLDGTSVTECIKKADEYKIELPQEYYDMIKKYGTYKDYIQKCLNINIQDLYENIKDKYYIKEVDADKYKRYLEFILVDSNTISSYTLVHLRKRFEKNYNKLPNELIDIYDKIRHITYNDDINIMVEYYLEVENFCKKYNLKNTIKEIHIDQVLASKQFDDNNSVITLGDIEKCIKKINGLTLGIAQLKVYDLDEFEKFDKMNKDGKFGTYEIYIDLKDYSLDDIHVKLNNPYDFRINISNPESKDEIINSFIKKYNIPQKNIREYGKWEKGKI